MEVKTSNINTIYGKAEIMVFKFEDELIIPVLYKRGEGVPLVRVQSQCFLGTVFSSTDCDCGEQVKMALKILFEQPHAALIYMMNQEARGHGLYKKIEILSNYHHSHDIEKARMLVGASRDMRKYDKVAEILKEMGLTSISLLTENEKKANELRKYAIVIEKIRGFNID